MASIEPPSRRAIHHQEKPASTSPWYLRVGWGVALVLLAVLVGLVGGFIWATARDYATLAANGHEIQQLTGQVRQLRHQNALLKAKTPQGNWWLWWASAPVHRLWLSLHL